MDNSEERRADCSDDENEHHLTVTSFSGKPLLDSVSAVRSSPKKADTKRMKKREEKERIEALRSRFTAPDGGYGWFVAFGAFLVQFWMAGMIKSYGVIFLEVMQAFPASSASLASWIPAILACTSLVLAPISTGLCEKFSCRSVVFVGGILCWIGISLSFFATSLVHLLITFGILGGIGVGLSTTPGIIMTSRYFNKHRGLANGICVSGTAAGGIAIPPLMQFLVPMYGFRGSILIMGACMLHVCLSAAIYRPLEVHQAIVELDKQKKKEKTADRSTVDTSNNCATEVSKNLLDLPDRFLAAIPEDNVSINSTSNPPRPQTPSQQSRGWMHSVVDLSTDSTVYLKDQLYTEKQKPSSSSKSCMGTLGRYMDFSLIRNPLFILLTLTVMLMATGCPHALFYLPSHAYSLGLTRSDSSLLLSISAAFDFLGRIGLGYIADLNLIPNSKAYSLSMLVAGVSVLCIPFASTFSYFAIIVGFYGFGLGSWFLLIPVLLSEHHGTEAIGSSYGLIRLFQGLVTLVIPPFIGFTKDSTGSFITGFYIMGASMILGAILINFEPCVERYTKRKKEEMVQSQTDA